MPSMLRPRMFLDVNIGTEPIGRLVVELFIDKTPKTCENFRTLCIGSKPPLSYRRAPLHRVIPGFMIQGGDTTKRDGTGGASIYGSTFEDENISWREIDAPGLVCMETTGEDTNGSQDETAPPSFFIPAPSIISPRFFITLAPCPHLTGKHTVFGHLVSGQDAIDRILKVPIDKDDRPTIPILIASCGELHPPTNATRTRKIMSSSSKPSSEDRGRCKRRRSPSHSPLRSESPDRGHTRTSGSRHRHHHRKHRHVSSSPSPTPPEKRNRRRSDADLDHNLRGRPRQRSRHRTRSPILESMSPPRPHRKRSQPPSRRRDSKEGGRSPDRRRQRSLPNLYNVSNGEKSRDGSGPVFTELLKDSYLRSLRDGDVSEDALEDSGSILIAGG